MNNPDIVNMLPYKRTAAVMLLLAIATIGLWVGGAEELTRDISTPIAISGISLIAVSIITSAVMLALRRFRPISHVTFAAYCVLLVGSLLLYSPNSSNYLLVVPWVLIIFLASRWEWRGIMVAATAAIGLIIWRILGQNFAWTNVLDLLALNLIPLGAAIMQFHNRRIDNSEDTLHMLAQELSQVSSKSDIIVNTIGEGVVAVDNKGTIQLINPAAEGLTGWTNFDALGLSYLTVLKFVDDQGNLATSDSNPIQSVLLRGTPLTRNDLRLVTNSGKKLDVSLMVSPIGKFGNGAIIVFRDITREVAQNREQVEFISTASHEMRTPVAAIEGYLSLAANPQTAAVDERARSYIMKAHESAEHLGRLFQDLLDVSRAEDGRLKNEPRVLDATEFVRESCAMLLPKANSKGISLEFMPDSHGSDTSDSIIRSEARTLAPTTYLNVDPDHLREIMANLIDNAIKYTKVGDVQVDVATDGDKVIISVKDSGIGIAPEDVPHLFQKFYRIDSSDTREIGGTGLGLYLCRRLVESMDGHIWVESELGKGSTFKVSLARLDNSQVSELSPNVP